MSRMIGRSAGPIQKCQSVRMVVNTRPGIFFLANKPSSSPSPPSLFFLSLDENKQIIDILSFVGSMKEREALLLARRLGDVDGLVLRRPRSAAVWRLPNDCTGTESKAMMDAKAAVILRRLFIFLLLLFRLDAAAMIVKVFFCEGKGSWRSWCSKKFSSSTFCAISVSFWENESRVDSE